ncbi:hypothetical protein GCM10010310_13620 [Streptomyces violaceolatus]|uniref:Uncharacterized protein n=1 Tax=Streptomyces violaceolatus TaxID=67378 RepID=A0ABN3SBD4_9ACTN
MIDLPQTKSLLSPGGGPLELGDDAARPPYRGQHDGSRYPVAVIDSDETLGRTAGGPILLAYTGASCHPGPGTPGTGRRMLD